MRGCLPPNMGGQDCSLAGKKGNQSCVRGTDPKLLFDVTALLITSTALGSAAEVSVAPAATTISEIVPIESQAFALVHSAVPASDAGVPPVTITTASSLVDPGAIAHGIPISVLEIPVSNPTEVRSLAGISFVRGLAALSASQIDKIVSDDPGVITKVLGAPPSAADVSTLWATLSPDTRSKLVATAPHLVGSLDGFPASVRNTANREWVSKSISSLKSKMSAVTGRVLAASDQHTLDMLTKVDTALKPTKNGPTRTLLSVDPTGEGKAVIVLGNLQTADYVTYMVPGMFYTVDGQLGAWTGDAADLYKQQVTWLHRLSTDDPSDAHKTVAVVAWMGYQTPDLTNIGSLALADTAKVTLTRDVEAMQAQRVDNPAFTTIIAHSYGSTAALMALTDSQLTVNALVLVGTPGSSAQSAKDLSVLNNNVWVGAAAWDPVTTSAFFGSDPSAQSYGAHKLGVGGGTDVITGKPLGQSIGHNEYFDPNTESIRNMALVGIDQGGLVLRGDAADAHRTLTIAK